MAEGKRRWVSRGEGKKQGGMWGGRGLGRPKGTTTRRVRRDRHDTRAGSCSFALLGQRHPQEAREGRRTSVGGGCW